MLPYSEKLTECSTCEKPHKECIYDDDPFLEWMVGILGPVILGAKPAEILSFTHCEMNQKDKLEKIDVYFTNCKLIQMKKIPFKCGTVRVLFYNHNALEETLADKRNLRFLHKMGYPKEYHIDTYLDHLIEKMSDCSFPHEIGVFLGYPLKDVLGFLGDERLKHSKTRGWRFYGDPRISDEKFDEIQEAKCEVKSLLLDFHPLEIIL